MHRPAPRRLPGSCLLGFLLLLGVARPLPAADLVLKDTPVHVYFSPGGGAQAALTAAIGQARATILVQAYSFTSAPIAGALKAAHDRGVAVRAILDKSQRTERYSGLTYLVHAGIPVWVDAAHPIAHDKVMVIDGRVVVTGSFNFTRAAEEKNGENLLIIESPALAQLYTKNWQAHLAHSDPVD
ncbi:MAG: phospholipase D family protein [Holophaga sp.]|jgi:phosphatidylserine/phosphatidylglycerophosphate/cardiolipin synthase-like enzyme